MLKTLFFWGCAWVIGFLQCSIFTANKGLHKSQPLVLPCDAVAFSDEAARTGSSREKTNLENPQIFQICKDKPIFRYLLPERKRRQF